MSQYIPFLDTKDSQKQLEALARAISSIQDYAIFLLDEKGFIVTWNKGAERMEGYSAGEIIGKHFSIFYLPEDIKNQKPQKELEGAKKYGRFEDEGLRLRKDGTTFWANAIFTPVYDEHNNFIGYSKVIRDLSERKKIEESLQQSEERFRMLVETVEDYAIFVLDSKGHVATWNAGAEKFKGYKPTEIIGKHFSVFYPEEDVKAGKCDNELKIAAREGKCIDEGWRIRKDGTKFWAYVVITALRDKNQNLIGFSKVTRDLTERKLSEELLQKANWDLERKVEERTAELLETNKELEQFAYVASHDLQEPLRKIIAFSERLREYNTSGDEKEREFAEKINKSGQRMRKIIEDLLDYSSIQANQIKKEPTDLNVLIEEILSDIEHKIIESNAKINVVKLPILTVSTSRMRHLFQNLILNSLKFSKKGVAPVIAIDYKEERGKITIYFKDNGIGFDQAHAETIFKPFKRLHTKQEYEGSGIGLALCQKIALQHDGSITAISKLGEGATFILTLPKT